MTSTITEAIARELASILGWTWDNSINRDACRIYAERIVAVPELKKLLEEFPG